jgi:methylenetetrahydrofolate reductase (NADPH)
VLGQALQEYPSITYHASNRSGDSFSSNGGNAINAVTWGIFPNQEVQQPTVVDPDSFIIWKDEAFALWVEHWGTLYPRGSPSRKLIDSIANEFYLINMVDNNFVDGDMSVLLDKVMVEVQNKRAAAAEASK